MVYIALGSNLGNSRQVMEKAILRLHAFADGPLRASSFWQTSPVDCPPGSPPFINAVVEFKPKAGETPETLLAKLQAIEREFGRQPKRILNEPRPLDLDLLAFGRETRATPQLTLPHPRAHQRRFVLAPLNEIAPDLILPGQTQTVAQLLAALSTSETIVRLNGKEITMPSLDIYLVDWKEAQKRHKQGTLRETLQESAISGETWAEDLCWFEKASADYFDVAEAWEQMRDEPQDVPRKMHKAAMDFMNVLITYDHFHNDLEEDGEDFLLAISPASAARFAKLAAQVDFSLYRKAFETACAGEETLERLSADTFLTFINAWTEIINKAATQKKGLLYILE